MWLFDQPENCATLGTTHVMRYGAVIVLVVHEKTDYGWQFLSGYGASLQIATVVTLSEIVEHDPSVVDVADLSPGWIATRTTKGDSWIRQDQYADATEIVID